MNKLYVGNISYDTTSKDLISLFSEYGEVLEAMILIDKNTGKSKGFGFVSFVTPEEASAALALNGVEHQGRRLVVQPARENI
ncbi:RNA-binding protein [Candidatus Microgenomates bacterium]|nr:MAG: RNA-binding protein [Candidatus Microgenomates bacterium]